MKRQVKAADEPQEVVRLSRNLRAPRVRVFEAFASAASLKQWLCPLAFTVPAAEADFRVGGRYRITMRGPDAKIHVVGGRYAEIRRPELVVFTWMWEPDNELAGVETTVRVELEARGAETMLVMTHAGLPTEKARASHTDGWTSTWEHLAQVVEGAGKEA